MIYFKSLFIFFSHHRCCCFFKRKKKKPSRQKWLAVTCSPEQEVVLLHTSPSDSKESLSVRTATVWAKIPFLHQHNHQGPTVIISSFVFLAASGPECNITPYTGSAKLWLTFPKRKIKIKKNVTYFHLSLFSSGQESLRSTCNLCLDLILTEFTKV